MRSVLGDSSGNKMFTRHLFFESQTSLCDLDFVSFYYHNALTTL